jgi:hypothetical protein
VRDCTATGLERFACRQKETVSSFLIDIHLQGAYLLRGWSNIDFGDFLLALNSQCFLVAQWTTMMY